jgi:hypothetical protein
MIRASPLINQGFSYEPGNNRPVMSQWVASDSRTGIKLGVPLFQLPDSALGERDVMMKIVAVENRLNVAN